MHAAYIYIYIFFFYFFFLQMFLTDTLEIEWLEHGGFRYFRLIEILGYPQYSSIIRIIIEYYPGIIS